MPSAEDTPPTSPDAGAGMFVAPSVSDLQEALPQFEIRDTIGQGGMGAVYKALQPRLNRNIAIKLLPPLLGDDEYNYAERFEGEAQAMAKMNHPNIVTVHDFGETDNGLRYIVMEYVEGRDLHTLIHGADLKREHVLSWIPQICSALQYAHEHNLVHRDIKPANILINDAGEAKVVDFGLAKLNDPSQKKITQLTRPDVAMGTADYAAPEAMEPGADVDHRADIYSLGVLFYEMLTGSVPRGAWQPPSKLNSEIDARFDAIIVKAMQPDRKDRYQSVAEISQALADIQRNPDGSAAAGPGPKKLAMGNQPSLLTTRHQPLDSAPSSGPSTAAVTKKSGAPLGLIFGLGAAAIGVIVALVVVFGGGGEDGPGPSAKGKNGKDKGKNKGQQVVQKGKDKDKGNQTRPPKPQPQPQPPRPQGPVELPDDARPDPLPEGYADALAIANMREDAYRGDWKQQGQMFRCRPKSGEGQTRLQLRQDLGSQFHIKTTFFRPVDGGDIVVVIPAGDGKYAPIHFAAFDDQFSGIAGIDRRPLNNAGNPTRRKSLVQTGKVHRAEIFGQIEEGRISLAVDVDRKLIFDWSGDLSQLPSDETWKPRDPTKITIGSTNRTVFLNFHIDPGEGVPIQEPTQPKALPSIDGAWVNLLEDLDIEKAAITGEWDLESGVLRRREGPARYARMEFPQLLNPNYDVEWSFRARRRVEDIQITLPLGNGQMGVYHLAAFGKWMGLAPFRGQDLQNPSNGTRRDTRMEIEKSHEVAIQVRTISDQEVAIHVSVDGEPSLKWNGKPDELGPNPNWEPRTPELLSLGSVVPVAFQKVRVRGVSDSTPPSAGSWVDALERVDPTRSALAGVWARNSDGSVRSDSANEFARLQLPVQVPDDFNFDVEAVARLESGDESLVVSIPMPEGRCAPVAIGAFGNFAGILGLDGFALGVRDPNVTKKPFKVEPERDYKMLIQARMTSPEIAQIGLFVDGDSVFTWSGEVSRLRSIEDAKWTTGSRRLVAIGSHNPCRFSSVRIQPNSEPLPMSNSAIDVEIAKLTTEYEGRIVALTGPDFDEAIVTLNQGYRNALDRVLNGTDEIANRFARAEALRLQNGGEIEAEDPADMPESMTKIRDVYRREYGKHTLARDVKAYPLLQEQLQKLQALADGGSPMDERQVAQAVMVLTASIAEIEKKAAIAGITLSQAPLATPNNPNAAFQRPTLPLSQPQKRGAVVAWDRTGGNKREGMGRVPGGLSQTVVAIHGGRDVAAALKSNGRVEVWGDYEYGIPESEIKDLDDVVRVQVSSYSSYFQVATLNSEGKIQVVHKGWDDGDTFTAQAHSFEKVVDLAVSAGGGFAIFEDGKTAMWGQIDVPSSPLSEVVTVMHGAGMLFAIHEDASVTPWGEAGGGAGDLGKVRHLGIGTQSDAPGLVVGLDDGSFRALGAFAPFEGELQEFAKDKTVRKLVAGFYAFAVEVGVGDRFEWKFFGQGISQEISAEEAKGCADLIIGREYVVGFRPL